MDHETSFGAYVRQRRREIDLTQEELARNHLGLSSDRAIMTWRKKNPAIDEMVKMMQAGPLFKHRAEIYTALGVKPFVPALSLQRPQ